jgi:hypothetical protein
MLVLYNLLNVRLFENRDLSLELVERFMFMNYFWFYTIRVLMLVHINYDKHNAQNDKY